MNLHKRNQRAHFLATGISVLAGLGLACLLTGTVGCKSADKKDDPLFGVKPPQVNPVPPTTGANPQARAGVPPIPGNTSAGSTAALASMPGSRPLSINAPPPSVPQKISTVPNVQPIPRDVPRTPGLLATGSWGQQTPPITPNLPAITPNLPPAPGDHSVDAPFAPLQVRGASAQFVDSVPEGVHLKVLFPNRAHSGSVRIYEATARDTAAAVEAVVQQIDQQRN